MVTLMVRRSGDPSTDIRYTVLVFSGRYRCRKATAATLGVSKQKNCHNAQVYSTLFEPVQFLIFKPCMCISPFPAAG